MPHEPARPPVADPVAVAPVRSADATRDLTGHRRVAAVLEVLALHHVRPELRQLPAAVRTARAAADALGVTPAEIANSLDTDGKATSDTKPRLLELVERLSAPLRQPAEAAAV